MSQAAPGNPADPQKSTENWIVAKKDRSKYVFLWIFVHKHGFLAFCKIFHRFSTRKQRKINEKKTVYFLLRRLFFSTWRPSRNTVFYNAKATFSFSVFLYFFLNIIEKSAPKFKPRFFPQKSLKSRPREPFWVPKRVPGDDFWVIFEGKTWSRFRNTFFDDFF